MKKMKINNKEVKAIKVIAKGEPPLNPKEPGSNWWHRGNILFNVIMARKGEDFGVEQFRDMLCGVNMAAGFNTKRRPNGSNYVEDWAGPKHIKDLADRNCIELIYETDKLDDYEQMIVDYLEKKNDGSGVWVEGLQIMKDLGVDPMVKSHRGWRTFKAFKKLEELDLIEGLKLKPEVQNSRVLYRIKQKTPMLETA